MKILDWLRKKKPEQPESELEEPELKPENTLDRDDVDMTNDVQRKKYIESCLEQIAEASEGMQRLENEYQNVNAYLKDMEEVEMLEGEDKELLVGHARQVSSIARDSAKYGEAGKHLKDADYRKMMRFEADVEDNIEKLREAETYQDSIRQDLKRLEGEKQAYLYRQSEAAAGLNNYRGMAVILVCAIFVCIAVLLFLQFGLELDPSIGYVLVMLTGSLALVFLYIRYVDTLRELEVVSANINKLIILQNRVKIRYVNNTNLLDYLYLKYEIPSADSLKKLWDQYQEEKEERMHVEQMLSSMDHHKQEMIKLLRRYHLNDPEIWTRQTEAILDQREMVEVRHHLITRRQKLRKQMDYNRMLAQSAQNEVKELARLYPEYATEIMDMVDEYEKTDGITS